MSCSDNQCIEDGAAKLDAGKPRMDLVPYDVMSEVADVFGFGSDKYSDWNWANGMRWCRMIAACLRHLGQWQMGEDNDEESGKSHIAHAICCLIMLLGSQKRGVGDDDRWVKPESPKDQDVSHCGSSLPCIKCEIRHRCNYYDSKKAI